MSEAIFADKAEVAKLRRTADGYLVANVRVAKGGNIQTYTGAEAGMPARETVRVWRPEDVVFAQDTMRGWAYKPITFLHPQSGTVSAENWRDEAVGMAGGEVMRDGEFVTVPLCLMDGATIEAVEGKAAVEVSCGYRVALDEQPGTTPDGREYDAKVTRIIPNHIAVVPRGRAGSECRIGDGANTPGRLPGPHNPPPTHTKERRPMAAEDTGRAVILVDGFTVETTPQGREAIERLQRQLADANNARQGEAAKLTAALDERNAQLADAKQSMKQALDAKDGEIAGLKVAHQQALDTAGARIAELEARTSPLALEAAAAHRAHTVGVARRFLGDAFTGAGLPDGDIRKAVVVKTMGPALADADARGQDFYDHAFETIASMVPVQQSAPRPDPLRDVLAAGGGAVALDAQRQAQQPSGFARNLDRLTNGWKTAQQGNA